MKRLLGYFMEGILVLAPLALTVYVIGRVLNILESLGETLLGTVLPRGLNLPGIGIVIAVALITVVGFLAGNWFTRRIIVWTEAIFNRIPLVRSIFSAIKDVVDAFGGKKQSFSKVVLVRVPGMPIELLGFVTSEDLSFLGDPGRGKVSVYVPQSLQLGGFVAVVPRENVTVLDTPPQTALKFLMTAGMTMGEGAGAPVPSRRIERGRG